MMAWGVLSMEYEIGHLKNQRSCAARGIALATETLLLEYHMTWGT